MCGIVGYVGTRPAVDVLIRGLRRLEYRGYDSAGVAFFRGSRLEIRKAEGKLENVEKLLNSNLSSHGEATCGIGHTRWATHGKPTTQNAHPHQTGHVVLVHNGIIENYQEIKREIVAKGFHPKSETDSELFGFLVLQEMDRGANLTEAVRRSFAHVQGACSVVVMSEREPGVVVGVRNGSPLVAARDPLGGAILASDAQPLIEYTREVIFLEQGDMAVASRDGLRFFSLESGRELQRETATLDWSLEKLDKQGFAHYMLKEIHEQPTALVDTLNGLLDRVRTDPFPLAEQPGVKLLDSAREILIVACGTSWHAAQIGKYWIERWARVPVSVDLASEFRYRSPVVGPGTVVIGISQSGETADTLAVIRQMKEQRIPTLAVTNVRGSTLSREADAVFYTSAGPEIGVAATKTFTAQLFVLLLLSGYLSLRRGADSRAEIPAFFEQLVKVPHILADCLGSEAMTATRKAAAELVTSKGFFFIGRGYSFPVALEGALKLKEIAYIHAEGYAAGELKHGPIAMIDEGMTVVVLAPQDAWRDKTVSNLEEVKARGARIVGIGAASDSSLASLCHHWIPLPSITQGLDESLLPFLLTPILQLFSYEIATIKGTDVDKPRNLAKSVTVE
ncbi:MAG: glutamine--fructose-6-phosphate transaminase (isomerizing) [Oligoflexia bacterium]|nr:glutamine--fructose-6-phosphate transaminase (isomerizing) [Oligoflexia bacterium]